MLRELKRFMERGQHVEIMYIDRNGRVSQRVLRLQAICGNHLKAYCCYRKANRVFALDQILAVLPVVSSHAV